MNAVEPSVVARYHLGQNQADNDVGQTKHWTHSRTVRAISGIAVLAVGGLAGLAASFFASTFVAIIAAAAVAVVAGAAVIGYFYHHSGDSHTPQPPASPGALPIQPPPYTPTYVPPPPYSPPSAQAATATSYAPAFSSNIPPSDPPPAYPRYGTPAAGVVDPYDLPPEYTAEMAEDFIRDQENRAERMLRENGLELYRSCRDGNCFYDSIAHQLRPQIANGAAGLRRQVADFARAWQQRHPVDSGNFSPIEARVFARLREIVAVPGSTDRVATGLDEIGILGCFADLFDIYFASQVVRRPITVINTFGGIVLAVDENGQPLDWTPTYRPELLRQDGILLVHDSGHFMGAN